MNLQSRYEAVSARIARSAREHGRAPEEIRLLAASKGQPISAIRELAALGQQRFGENYLQEALPKIAQCTDLALEWHFIGHVQANKAGAVATHFDWVQSVDRRRLAQRLNDLRPANLPRLNVCLQVNLDAEPGKSGVATDTLAALAEQLEQLPRLQLRGLMAIPAPVSDPAAQQRSLHRLRQLYDQLRAAGHGLDTLSMGMSADLEAAVAQGSTMVRIGHDLMGPRGTTKTTGDSL